MNKSLSKILFSTRLTAILFVVFAVAMIVGTGIESKYSTETAIIWIYDAWWFELIMAFFMVNFCGNIVRYKLHRKEKWPVLLLHLSFILVLLGAFVTRYFGFEGMMPIQEGNTEKVFYSEKTYLTAFVDGEINGEPKRRTLEEAVRFTPEASQSSLPWNSDFNGQEFTIDKIEFIKGAEESLVPDPNGKEFLKIVEAGGGERHDHYLENGTEALIHGIAFTLNQPKKGAINIRSEGDGFTIESPFEGNFMRMADRQQGKLVKDSIQPLMLRSLYNAADMQFVFPEPFVKGRYDIVAKEKKTENDQDALVLSISTKGETKELRILGSKGLANDPKTVSLGGLDFHLSYGSKLLELPFSIKLNDFVAEKYPGTEQNPTPSYSSFMSKVTVNDERSFDYDIYMNHVLDHQGYRFFQASFIPGERGTILSVNHDFWGTWITYIGYFLLYFGLMAIMFAGKTRFKDLGKKLIKLQQKKKAMTMLVMLLFSLALSAQDTHVHTEGDGHDHETEQPLLTEKQFKALDSALVANAVTKEHAANFGNTVIQDVGGRMKPINTFASEMLRKVSKRAVYEGLNADQVLLSMTENPFPWYNAPLIYVKWQNDSIRRLVGAPEDMSRLPIKQFFGPKGEYKLAPYLEESYAAFGSKTANSYHKGIVETDRRVNLLYSALDGSILRVFPIPNDENNTWIARNDIEKANYKGQDSLIKNWLPMYRLTLKQGRASKSFEQSDLLLDGLVKFQNKYGSKIMPSKEKIAAEVTYNRWNIFNKLYRYYGIFGLFMLAFLIAQIYKDRKALRISIASMKVIIIGLLVLHLVGVIARWYISGHAPWSNAYEAIIFVSLAVMALGAAFIKKSSLTFAGAAFVTAILLWVAHQNWTDPAIANLVPVLDSYWLMIHVAVIVGSYGPFTLGAILGIIVLVLILFTNQSNKKRMKLAIQEITIVNELVLTVGLVMLTIGNFLGGQWANESWGRYWGWDPKETWALISIMVYAFVVHMRLIPGLKGRFAFNLASIVAFMAIIFTYFGVNFQYLMF